MYDYIKGQLVSKNISDKNKTITIECNSIGYLVNVNSRIIDTLPPIGENLKIYLTLIHKEDSMSLCGFLNKEDRDIFNILQSVSGVGVKVSLVLLDEYSALDLISFVINEDSKALSRAKGVGSKMAQKIVIELKDKLLSWQNNSQLDFSEISSGVKINDDIIQEVQTVLLSLGYSIQEIKDALNIILKKNGNITKSEDLLKEVLSYLSV